MMPVLRSLASALVCLGALSAQAPTGPVVNPRGVINAFTQQPAPSAVGPGGILWISGLNLGPAEGAKASGSPLPMRLAEPAVEVLINNRVVPLFSVNLDRIVAQVPFEINPGLAEVVVRRGGVASRPARIFINQPQPSLRTAGDRGFGEVAGNVSGQTLAASATGLGVTDPRVPSGEAGPADPPATPRGNVRAYVGGLPANVTAALSTERVGEFDIRIEVPAGAQAGDVVTLLMGNRPANRATYGTARTPEIQYTRLPEGSPEIRSIESADLRGNYLIASGARETSGCYPSVLFDLAKSRATRVDNCLTTGNRNAPSPIVAANEGPALAALVGPPQGQPPEGVSAKVRIFHPAKDEPIDVDLPAAAINLGGDGVNFTAVLAGTPPRPVAIDAFSGEVRDVEIGPGAGAGGGAVIVGAILNLTIDLGDGLTHVLSLPVQLPGGMLSVVVGNDADKPTRAKLAILNAQREVAATRDFPEGWVPLIAPRPETPAGGGGIPGGGGGGGAPVPGGQAIRSGASTMFDGPSRVQYVLARRADNSRHGFVAFAAEDVPVKALEFPDAWFVAACTAQLPLFNLELSRRIALPGSNVAQTEVRNPCPAQGFLLLDLAAQSVSAVALPGQGQFNAAGGASSELNDYIFGSNTDPARRGISDTLYVLDGVTASLFRMDLPSTVTGFTNLVPVPSLSMLVGLATNRVQGDAGLVLFDLDRNESRMLPTPEGFAAVQFVGVFPTTRKIVARGIKTGNTGSQYLIYDLLNGDLAMPPNPEGVAFVGGLVQQQPQPGQGGGQPPPPGGQPGPGGQPVQPPAVLQDANQKANTVAGVCFNAERQQVGVMVLRVN